MYKKIFVLLYAFFSIFILNACAPQNAQSDENDGEYRRFRANFIGLFDTHTTILGYATSEEEFSQRIDILNEELTRLHELFDIYNEYDGINNLKTINDNAGIQPIEVDPSIISLINFSKEAYNYTDGLLNIALGPVLTIWHEYRAFANINPDLAELPSMEKLKQADNYTNINDIIIDEENNTVFLLHENMSLDVGAIAKGYAVEVIAQKAKDIGLTNAVISVGGDIRTLDGPPVGRRVWAIGIQDPNRRINDTQNTIDTVYVTNNSVVTSGDYQRFFVVDGQVYHHIINPRTLMPLNEYRAVSVIHPDASIANILSTAIFLLPIDEGIEILKSFEAEAIWILNDESIVTTDGYKLISRSFN